MASSVARPARDSTTTPELVVGIRRMGRRNRRKPEPERGVGRAGLNQHVERRDGRWEVRRISGAAALKEYRCPGCDQAIPQGVPHVVAWWAEDPRGGEARRHWHTTCWERELRTHG